MHKLTPMVIVLAAACSFILLSPVGGQDATSLAGVAQAQDDWRTEFDELCGKTQETETLSVEDLKKYISECDKLKLKIEKQDETIQKVYLKRLQMCRDLFVFMIDTKEKKEPCKR